MTGKAYYLTTLGDWQRHAARFSNSHFIVLTQSDDSVGAAGNSPTTATSAVPNPDAKILALIEADEGVHLSLEDEAAFEPLPHPLAQKPISAGAQAALASHGVAPGATTFDAAEAVAPVHPLLRHRVF
jgi:hypothetical protein